MHLVYTYEEPPDSYSKSIFLAGPTPRTKSVQSWRTEALRLLEAKGYDGVVFVPEDRNGDFEKFDANYDYEKTTAWEQKMLDKADCDLFWIPRDLSVLPDNKGMKIDRKSTRLNSSHSAKSRMPSSA